MYDEIATRTRFELCALLERIRQSQHGNTDQTKVLVSLNVDPRNTQLNPGRAQLLMNTLKSWGALKIKRVDEGSVLKNGYQKAPTLTYHLKLHLRKFREAERELRGSTLKTNEASKDNIATVHLRNGKLTLNKTTGAVTLNNVESKYSPKSYEFKFLLALVEGSENTATYQTILGKEPSSADKETLQYRVKNIKRVLKILPKKEAENEDVIENIKNQGYKLIT